METPLEAKFAPEEAARSTEEVSARHADNRAAWNEAARHYQSSLQDTLDSLRAGKSNLHPVERANLGNLRDWCKTAIHLQCASGRDTLSLWVEGVEKVIGMDISDLHIENARWLTAQLNAPAEWYRCDVLEAPAELDGCADLVYTGRGALCWLHDLDAWAQVVYRLLKPGGVFHVLDGHPVTWLFEMDAETYIASNIDYFQHAERSKGWPDSYINDLDIGVAEQSWKHERLWNLAAVVNALIRAGLVIEFLGEHPEPFWDEFPHLKPELAGRIPNTFSVRARKP